MFDDEDVRMDPDALEVWIKQLIKENNLYKFYKDKKFRELREEVLKEQHYECQMCGMVADTVHHIQFVRKYPRLALSKYYYYKGVKHRNLIAVCRECHALCHPEKRKAKGRSKFINEEKC